MRTTVTLEQDTAALLAQYMRDKGVSFKRALNDVLRSSLAPRPTHERVTVRTRSMGKPAVDLDKAAQLASSLDDIEVAHKLELRK